MSHVEVHPLEDGYQIRYVHPGGVDEPFVSAAEFIGPVLGELGIATLGPWQDVTDPQGVAFRRAEVIR